MQFADTGTADIYHGRDTKKARRTLPQDLWNVARRKLDMLNAAVNLNDLKVPPANRLEKLTGDLEGHWSIRINDQYRIVLKWDDKNGASEVGILDYH